MKKFICILGLMLTMGSQIWSAMPDMIPVWKLIDQEKYEDAQKLSYELWFKDHKRYPIAHEVVYYYIINSLLFQKMGKSYEADVNLKLAFEMMHQSY